MKNIYRIMAAAAAIVTAASCDLSEYDPNNFGEARAFGTESSVQLALNGFYADLPSLKSGFSGDQGDSDYAIVATTMDTRYTVAYGPELELSWDGWDELRDYNYFLQMMNSSACGVEGAVKDNFVAQGRYFRAEWYFSMLKKYGDLPWYDHMITEKTNDEYKERDSRDDVIKYIIEDLDYAMENITDESSDHTAMSKYVAAFTKMRACLYEASFRKYNNVTASVTGKAFTNYTVEELYEEAVSAAEFIINSGKFSLAPDYRSLFTSDDLVLSETILGAETDATVMGNQNSYYNYSNSQSLVRAFVNTYLMKDGTPYTSKSGYQTETFDKEFAGRDPRLIATVRTPGYEYGGKVVVPSIADQSAPLGYQVIKFCVDYAPDGANDQKGNSNPNALPNMRYAEVLLAYAEAKAELGTFTDADWANTVGAIRKRAGITGGLTSRPTTVDSYLKANFYPDVTDASIMEIRRERGCELCLEGQRNEDVIRWGCGKLIASLPWEGINFPALDTPVDADGDGSYDYYFSNNPKSSVPAEYQNIYVSVNGSTGLKVKSNGAVKQLEYSIASANRVWESNRSLCAIPALTISTYTDHGYTLTQNPGY